jgi:hypothetical protein
VQCQEKKHKSKEDKRRKETERMADKKEEIDIKK